MNIHTSALKDSDDAIWSQ